MPLITPILATLCIFSAVGQWNSFTDTMILMPSGKYYTLQFLLYKYQNEASSLATLVRNTQDSSAQANVATKQTALSVGYSDMKHFYNIFKKEFGVTPNEYKTNRKL